MQNPKKDEISPKSITKIDKFLAQPVKRELKWEQTVCVTSVTMSKAEHERAMGLDYASGPLASRSRCSFCGARRRALMNQLET